MNYFNSTGHRQREVEVARELLAVFLGLLKDRNERGRGQNDGLSDEGEEDDTVGGKLYKLNKGGKRVMLTEQEAYDSEFQFFLSLLVLKELFC